MAVHSVRRLSTRVTLAAAMLLLSVTASHESADMPPSTFQYFAYGSNLLAKRIHIQNPTAVRRGYGYLQDYSLDFFNYTARWRGSPATIVEHEGARVWGAIWEIDMYNLDDLDRQESVPNKVYKPLTLPIVKPSGDTVECRIYQLVHNPQTLASAKNRPYERQPSRTYMEVIINGAIETGLPEEYIAFLKTIKHNDNSAGPEISRELEKHTNDSGATN